MFEKFSQAYPRDPNSHQPIDAATLTAFSQDVLGVASPSALRHFWEEIGSGYFGERVLFVFGDGTQTSPRESFQDWNTKDFWTGVYPPPAQGGPVFFAETCFGDQLGFRWDGDNLIFVLFVVDTFEAFVVARDDDDLFERVLTDPTALVDKERFRMTRERLGPLKGGMHYAPLVSPLVGGTGDIDNMCLETANVHFRTAIATYGAIHAA